MSDSSLGLTCLATQIIAHRITEWSGLEGTSVGHLVQPPAKAGSPREGCFKVRCLSWSS